MRAITPIDVSILVVSYNTRELTRAALDSLLAETKGVRYEVIVVDNVSGDGSADMIRQHPAKPELIALNENIGFARANNLAARRARGRYLLLLNPDTVVLDGAIDKLVAFARAHPKGRIWGGRTLFADGSLNPASCWGRMTPWNLICRATGLAGLFRNIEIFNGEALGGWQRDSVRQVDIVSGCFFLIEKELWDGLNGFDPMFFMYGEEADLCLRAHAFSARPLVTPDATIIHYGGASETARTGKMIKLLAAKASLIDRHWPEALAPLGLWLLSLWPLTRTLAHRLRATLWPSANAREQAATWGEIWSRRAEWRYGYPKLAAPSRSLGRGHMLAPISG
jgi:N-acetylglucosaminyl-diphospho-decaprenol L-rhamnosyltransferase